ncbi:unnamed protein product, partial [Ixodes persulcatus]
MMLVFEHNLLYSTKPVKSRKTGLRLVAVVCFCLSLECDPGIREPHRGVMKDDCSKRIRIEDFCSSGSRPLHMPIDRGDGVIVVHTNQHSVARNSDVSYRSSPFR